MIALWIRLWHSRLNDAASFLPQSKYSSRLLKNLSTRKYGIAIVRVGCAALPAWSCVPVLLLGERLTFRTHYIELGIVNEALIRLRWGIPFVRLALMKACCEWHLEEVLWLRKYWTRAPPPMSVPHTAIRPPTNEASLVCLGPFSVYLIHDSYVGAVSNRLLSAVSFDCH